MAKILVVEDERSVRQALMFEFMDEGHDVHCASGFEEAASAIRAFRYDVIISDIFLDDGNGVQLMELARKMNRLTPFIVISAFTESDLARQVKAILKDRFFEKPFHSYTLMKKVGEVLQNSLLDNNRVLQEAS
jgi:DNA-binding NtrC family response regulator